MVCQDYKEAGNQAVISALEPVLGIDEGAKTGGCVVPVSLPCARLVYSPTGPLDRDYDDHRRFAEAASSGVKKAVAAGAKHPLLAVKGCLPNKTEEDAQLSALLGALAAVYVRLEMWERANKIAGLGWGEEGYGGGKGNGGRKSGSQGYWWK